MAYNLKDMDMGVAEVGKYVGVRLKSDSEAKSGVWLVTSGTTGKAKVGPRIFVVRWKDARPGSHQIGSYGNANNQVNRCLEALNNGKITQEDLGYEGKEIAVTAKTLQDRLNQLGV